MNIHDMKKEGVARKKLRLDRSDIAYLKFIIEGYEDIAVVTTIDKNEAIIQLTIMPDFVSEMNVLLEALKEEINFYEIEG